MIKINLLKSFDILFNMLEILLFIRLIMSMLGLGYGTVIWNFIYELTEPILKLSRWTIEKTGINTGIFDFSYIVAMFYLRIVYAFLFKIIKVVIF